MEEITQFIEVAGKLDITFESESLVSMTRWFIAYRLLDGILGYVLFFVGIGSLILIYYYAYKKYLLFKKKNKIGSW